MRLSLLLLFLLLLGGASARGQALQITEFMADPNPVVGLPEAEFVEVYNAGEGPVDVSELRVASGGRAVHAGAGADPLAPGAFLVLVPEAYAEAFSAPGVRVHALSLPGLTNGGDEIAILLGADTVSYLVYDESWYRDEARDNGGYSIEYTGLGDPGCGGNWRASLSANGGTPGLSNSVLGRRADTVAPAVIESAIDSSGIRLVFSEEVVGPVFLSVNGAQFEAVSTSARSFFVHLGVTSGTVYDLVIFADYADCAGNFPAADTPLQLLLADEPVSGQVIINELLFNPVGAGSDYLEIYNNGLTAIDLRGLTISNESSNARPVTTELNYILKPGAYAVFTEDPAALQKNHPAAQPSRVIKLDLPAFPNQSGNVTLRAPSGTVIDAFDYSEDLHSELLSSIEGVSLERVSPSGAASVAGNWHSATSASGYGTPTLRNSQYGTPGGMDQRVSLAPTNRVFSPDGDGYEDHYLIAYTALRSGAYAEISVFNLDGRLVTPDPVPQLLGQEGELSWSGLGTNGRAVPPGPYVVLVEIFTPYGYTQREKLVAVIAPSR